MRTVVKPALGRPSTFKREDIVDCALKMLDRDGVKALTLRGVARELGCVLGTLNYYFSNLADLEDAVTARLLEQVPVLDTMRAEPVREQLVELGLAQIEIHSMHPYVRHVAGPISIEIAARQLQQHWSTLQSVGLTEQLAMLCVEVVSGLAHNRGSEIYRLRTGGEQALRLHQEFSKKLERAPSIKLAPNSIDAKSMEPLHREMLGNAIDIFLRGSGIEEKAKTRSTARKQK
ncbi:MAG: hypothetical protein V4607_08075 [Pseudomonadota bacterium]